MICFYCGRLGHGTNDCKAVFGVSSPVKKYGVWIKASPWKPMRLEEVSEEMSSHRMPGKRLL